VEAVRSLHRALADLAQAQAGNGTGTGYQLVERQEVVTTQTTQAEYIACKLIVQMDAEIHLIL